MLDATVFKTPRPFAVVTGGPSGIGPEFSCLVTNVSCESIVAIGPGPDAWLGRAKPQVARFQP